MAKKGIGLYAEADTGWSNHLKDIFKSSGFGTADYAIVTLRLVAEPKQKISAKGNEVTTSRLRYQLHTEMVGTGVAKLPALISAGDDVHVVWIGHGGYVKHSDESKSSWKFAPHHGTEGVAGFMSAKELARCIHTVCQDTNGHSVYPASLTITSCYSGQPRERELRQTVTFQDKEVKAVISGSSHENPLAWRVLDHLYAMFDPPPTHKCTVAGPVRDLMGMEIRGLKVPPAGKDWSIGEL